MSTEQDQDKVKNKDLSAIAAVNLKKVKAEESLQMLKPRPALDEILNLNDFEAVAKHVMRPGTIQTQVFIHGCV